MDLLLVVAVIVAGWFLYSRSQVRDYGSKPGKNELQQLAPDAPPAAGGGEVNYPPFVGQTSTELEAVDPTTDPTALADYEPSGQWLGGGIDPHTHLWSPPEFIEDPLAPPRPN